MMEYLEVVTDLLPAVGEDCCVITIFDLSRDRIAERPLAKDMAVFEEHFGHKAVWWELA